MSYDEALAARVRRQLLRAPPRQVTERKMFGGICFLVGGAMCCGVLGRDLIVRVGPQGHADAVRLPHARVFDFTGRPSKGIVYVAPEGLRAAGDLRRWLARSAALSSQAPPKPPRR